MATKIEDVKKAERRERRRKIPLGKPRMKLSLSDEQLRYFQARGEKTRWFNDEPGRLEEAEDVGYRFVTKKELVTAAIGDGDATEREGLDSRVSRVVGARDFGEPIIAYLMAQQIDDYEEDQATKMAIVKKREDAMKQGVDDQGAPGRDGRYIPKQGIKITKPTT